MLNKISQVISGLSLIKFINSVIDGINAHLSDYNNPHKVTAAQLGLSNAYKYKGSVETYEDLPTSAESGDVYNVVKGDKEQGIADGANFAWDGTKWDNLGGLLTGTGAIRVEFVHHKVLHIYQTQPLLYHLLLHFRLHQTDILLHSTYTV